MNTRTMSHTHDPQVSRDAIEGIPKGLSHRLMQIIVDLIAQRGPLTPKELESIYQRGQFTNPTWPETKPFNVAKRASEMKTHVKVLHGTKIRRDGAEALDLKTSATDALVKITDYWDGPA